MKFCLRAILFVFIFTHFAFSQVISNYGIHFGLVSSQLSIREQKDNSSLPAYDERRIGPNLGVFIRYHFLSRLELETGLSYIQKGGTDKTEITTVEHPEGTGEYVYHDIYFNMIRLRGALHKSFDLSDMEIAIVPGVSVDHLISVNGGTLPKKEYSDYVFSYNIGVEFSSNRFLEKRLAVRIEYDSDISKIYDGEFVYNKCSLFTINILLKLKK